MLVYSRITSQLIHDCQLKSSLCLHNGLYVNSVQKVITLNKVQKIRVILR